MGEENNNWEILNSSYLMEEPWCTIRIDHVKLPNGVEIPNYYVLEYPNWINIVAITKDDEFLMVRQYRHGLRQRNFELIAGVCDAEDSSPLESAKRELLEESGYGNGKWEQLAITSPNPGTHTNLCYCFLAIDLEKVAEQKLESTEDLELHILEKEEVKQLLRRDKIPQAMHAQALWKYFSLIDSR